MASTEKTKHRMDTELEDLQLEFERVNAAAIVADKRAQNFDKVQIVLILMVLVVLMVVMVLIVVMVAI